MNSGTAVSKGVGIWAVALLLAWAALLPAAAQNGSNEVTDVMVGRNNKGPYMLSWTNMDPASVRVVINGMTLKRGEKYNIDYAKGMISFTSTVLTDAIVRVSYSKVPGKSQQNTNKVNVPVTLNVFQGQDASVQVTGLYAQDDPKNPDAGKTVVGVGGEKKWDTSKVSSQFFMSQRNEPNKNGAGGDAWDRSAFKLGSETSFGKLKIGGSVLNSGSQFAGGSETGLGTGKRASDLSVSFSPSGNVQASARVQQSEDTGGATKGNRSLLHDESVTVSPTQGTTVALTHSATQTTTAAADSGKTVDSTQVKVDQKIGAASASVAAASSTTTTATTTDTTTSQEVKFGSDVASGQVNLTQKDSDAQGQTNNTEYQRDFSIATKPVKFASVEASLSQKGVNENDDVTKSAKVEVSPFSHTQLSAGYKYVETGAQVMTIKDYGATTKPCGFIGLAASLRQRELAAQDAPDSSAVQLSLAPLKFVTLTGGYQSNPEDDKGQMQTYNATNLGMKVRFGSIGVTTDYKSKNEYTAQRLSDEGKVGFEMAGLGGGKLTTGLAISRLLDGSMTSTNTYSLGYRHEVGSAFEFALTGYYTKYLKDRVAMPDKTEYSAEASLGVRF